MTDRAILKKHIFRYLAGGASTTALCWGCIWAFVELADFHYLVATNLATFIAYFYSYAINKVFVFEDQENNHVLKGSKFLALQLTLLMFTNLFMFFAVSIASINYMIAVIIISIVNAVISFLVMRSAIFR